MNDSIRNDKRPHGETGDTVQQAAEVSRPTTDAGRVLDTDEVPQQPPNANTGLPAVVKDGSQAVR
jgi:hypothetical protein